MEKKKMKIAIDCGYSSFKPIINGVVISAKKNGSAPYPIGSEIIPIENNSEFIQGKTDDYIGINYLGRNYIVGDYARKLLMEKKWQAGQDRERSLLESYERFDQTSFIASLMACIGYSIVKYCTYTKKKAAEGRLEESDVILLEELNNVDICLALALPQAVYEKRNEGVVPALIRMVYKSHSFDMEIGARRYSLDFTINSDDSKILISSQVIAAYTGATTADRGKDGKILEKPQLSPFNTPILIIDGGYKTIGLFRLTRGGVVVDAESNTDYAMAQIDRRIEAYLAEHGRDDIKAYNLETLCTDESECVIKVLKDGKYVDYDLAKARAQYAVEYCNEFINYLDEKFRGFKDVKQILITGGTGALYFDQLKKHITETSPVSGPIELSKYKLLMQEITPAYAIVAGLFRLFQIFLEKYEKAK